MEAAEVQDAKSNKQHYPVHIDEEHFTLHTQTVTGAELLSLVGRRPCRYALVQVIRHADDQFVDPDERVDLSVPGAERFVTVQKDIVIIEINSSPCSIARGDRSVTEILALVGQKPEAYDLLCERDGAILPLPSNLPVRVEGCEVFHSQVSSGASS